MTPAAYLNNPPNAAPAAPPTRGNDQPRAEPATSGSGLFASLLAGLSAISWLPNGTPEAQQSLLPSTQAQDRPANGAPPAKPLGKAPRASDELQDSTNINITDLSAQQLRAPDQPAQLASPASPTPNSTAAPSDPPQSAAGNKTHEDGASNQLARVNQADTAGAAPTTAPTSPATPFPAQASAASSTSGAAPYTATSNAPGLQRPGDHAGSDISTPSVPASTTAAPSTTTIPAVNATASATGEPTVGPAPVSTKSPLQRLTAQAPPFRQTAEETSFLAQASKGLATALKDGEGTVVLRLSPEHLGQLTVQITRTEAGITARLEPSTPAARELLLLSEHSLRAALEARGLSVERIEVEAARVPGTLHVPDQQAQDAPFTTGHPGPDHPGAGDTSPQGSADQSGSGAEAHTGGHGDAQQEPGGPRQDSLAWNAGSSVFEGGRPASVTYVAGPGGLCLRLDAVA